MKLRNKSLAILLAVILVGCGNQSKTDNQNTAVVQEEEKDTDSKAEDTTDNANDNGNEAKNEEKEIAEDDDQSHYDVNLSMLAGPTSVGAINLVEESKNTDTNFTINEAIDGAPDAVVPKLVSGEADLAIIPANLAAAVYNKTEGKVKVLATNSLGVLYLVTNGDIEINSLEDLVNSGEEILASGKGATPEIAINKILTENGYAPEDLKINYLAQANEASQKLIAGEAKVAILPEPMVSTVLIKAKGAKVALDLNELYEEASGYPLISSVLVGRSEYLDSIDVPAFLDAFKGSIAKAKEDPETTGDLLEKYDIMPAAVAKKAIPNLALEYIDGAKLKEMMAKHLEDLNEANPQLVGGSIPADDFYFTK